MRIAMVCDMVPGQPGGSYVSTMRFAGLLTARGHTVVIIGAQDARQKPIREYLGIRFYQFPSLAVPGSHRYYFLSFATKRALKKIFVEEKIEVVHIMFPSYFCFVAGQVARELTIPLGAHCHTQSENLLVFLPHFLQTEWVNKKILAGLVWFLRPANVVISPSAMGKKILTDCDPALHVEVISNGIDLQKFQVVPTDSFRANHHLPTDARYLLCVARFNPEKEVGTLLRALPRIRETYPETHLLLVGTGSLRSVLEETCHSLGIQNDVHFLGKISDEELLAAYSLCEIFVLPSLAELEGMVVLEAMACKKPLVIADSPTSASRYFIRDNGYLFVPKDAEDLATKVLTVLGDGVLRARMGEASYADARAYDINASVEKLELVYEELLRSRSHRAQGNAE